MIDRVTYTTSEGHILGGRTFELDGLRAGVAGNDLRGWKWTVGASASLDGREYAAVVWFTERETADEFTRLCDRDLTEGRTGLLKVGEWGLACNVTAASCSLATDEAVSYEVTIHSSSPLWRRSTIATLGIGGGGAAVQTGLDHPTDYAFDYAGTSREARVGTISRDAMARVTFHGPCENPYVRLTSTAYGTATANTYGVSAACTAGERIVIDPTARGTIGASVFKAGRYGERTNLFAKRMRGEAGGGHHVFERMPAGVVTASWPQGIAVTVELIEERGQLPWA